MANESPKTHRRTIKIIVIICLWALYIGIGCILINNNYTFPNKIKNRQILVQCNATSIEYALHGSKYTNNTYVNEYSIALAKDSQGNDITKVFAGFLCIEKCPVYVVAPCYNYKSYFAQNREDINKKFSRVSYIMWFAAYWIGIGTLFEIGVLCTLLYNGGGARPHNPPAELALRA